MTGGRKSARHRFWSGASSERPPVDVLRLQLLRLDALEAARVDRDHFRVPLHAARERLDQPGLLRTRMERLRVLARQMAVRGLALGLEPDEIAEAVRAELAAHGRPVSGSPLQASLGQEEAPLLSARNRLRGRVAAIRAGEMLAEVTIDLREGAQVVAAVTRASVDRLGLDTGGPVSVYVKATELTLGP